MDVIPKQIPRFAGAIKGKPAGYFRKIDPFSEDAKMLSEADWDVIISDNLSVLADALREAEVISEDSTLRLLGSQQYGKQVDQVDLLLAEVEGHDANYDSDQDPAGWGELRRLVILEDKLMRNPEARKQVLAQVFDYSQTAEEKWEPDYLSEVLPHCKDWIEKNAQQLVHTVRSSDYLLIIAGDGIDPRLQLLAERFAGQDDPLNLTELCLVSMSMYVDPTTNESLLLPHVVSSVTRSEREVTVRVRVEGSNGGLLPCAVTLEQEQAGNMPGSRSLQRPEVVAFLRQIRPQLDPVFRFPGSRFSATLAPKKTLEYYVGDTKTTRIGFNVHFGLWKKDVFTPVSVYVWVQTGDSEARDQWKDVLDELALGNKLPEGFIVNYNGPRTVIARKDYEWEEGDTDALNPSFANSIVDSLRKTYEALRPAMQDRLGI